MPTLVYSPAIEVHIATAKNGIIDVSADISSSDINRSTPISTVSLTLTNALRKYDGMFTPMDRIVVYLRRITRMLVFSGYLDTVPTFSTYPGSIRLTASCSLKRLQNFVWDPHTRDTVDFLKGVGASGSNITDGGLAQQTVSLLNTVAAWPQAQIHIATVPSNWFSQISSVAKALVKEAEIASLVSTVGGQGYLQGESPFAYSADTKVVIPGNGPGTGSLPATIGKCSQFGGPGGGAYGGMALTGEPGGLPDSQRGQWGGPYYCAMKWPYQSFRQGDYRPLPGINVGQAVAWWRNRKILVVNPKTGKAVCVRAADWGPYGGGDAALASANDRIIDLSASAMKALSAGTDDVVHVAFAPTDMPLGPQGTTGTGKMIAGDAQLNAGLAQAASNSGVPLATDFADKAVDTVTKGHPAYHLGASADPKDAYPKAFDCSELVQWALARAGFTGTSMSGTAETQFNNCQEIPVSQALKTKGALLFARGGGPGSSGPNGIHHVAISLGDGRTVEARSSDKGCGIFNDAANWLDKAGLIRGVDYTGSGGPGVSGVIPGGGATSGQPDVGSAVGEALFNAFQWLGNPDYSGDLLAGPRALINDEPILATVDQFMKAGLRDYCSAPNGDFIAWFPDYFGHYGTAARMVIEDIEIEEAFNVAWSDDRLKTHMFVSSSSTGTEGFGDSSTLARMTSTAGIASVEMPELMKALFNVKGDEFADGGKSFLFRYGARPDFAPMDNITGHKQEFFFACYRFMKNWAEQYSCTISTTFMPELYPGMLAVFPRYGVQAYVQEVTHHIDMVNGSGFTTRATLIAWSTIGDQPSISGLPKGGTGK